MAVATGARGGTARRGSAESIPAGSPWPWALLLVIAGAAFWRLLGKRGIIGDELAEAA